MTPFDAPVPVGSLIFRCSTYGAVETFKVESWTAELITATPSYSTALWTFTKRAHAAHVFRTIGDAERKLLDRMELRLRSAEDHVKKCAGDCEKQRRKVKELAT